MSLQGTDIYAIPFKSYLLIAKNKSSLNLMNLLIFSFWNINAKRKKTKFLQYKVKPTVAGVSDTVLQDSEPLLLLLLGGHTEVVMMGIGVPEDQSELGVALDKGWTPHLGFYICQEEKQKHCRVNLELFTVLYVNIKTTTAFVKKQLGN